MINNNHADIIDRLDAMRMREETTKCVNYFENDAACEGLNASSREAMATWIAQVQRTLSLSPETVWIAMSYFDRYLGSGRGNSREVLQSKCKFQLAAITAFYTAVKIYEPVVLDLDLLIQICRGTYTASDITSMENDILSALDWRVSCHTPMDFARHLLELLPDELPSCSSDALLEDCQTHLDRTVADVEFSCLAPSAVGVACLASSLADDAISSPSEKRAIWTRLSELCPFDLSSREVIAALQRLSSNASPCSKHNSASKLGMSSRSNVAVPSSPICVTQVARQA